MTIKRPLAYLILAVITGVSLLTILESQSPWLRVVWEHQPFHSTIEAIGALIAIAMAFILLQRASGADGKQMLLAAGLLGMGILDGFHAATPPGNSFVLLRGASSLVGSVGFALACLPPVVKRASPKMLFPWMFAAVSVLLGALTFAFPASVPEMLREEDFTLAAVLIHLVAAGLFLVVAARFMLDFHNAGSLETFLFVCLALMFGLAALAFARSTVWRGEWWLWHALRLSAYLLALAFSIRRYLRMVTSLRVALVERRQAEEEMRQHRDRLEDLVRQRTTRLAAAYEQLEGEVRERKQAEQRAQHLRRQNELILNAAGEGILGLDLEGRHTFVNPAAASMLGYPVEELLGGPSHDIWHHTKRDGSPYPKHECPILASYQDGLIHRGGDEVFWKKNGDSFPVEYISTPVWGDGQLVGAVVVFADTTERVRAEGERDALIAELETKNAEMERFTYTVSHDLKSPLITIQGFLGFLKQDALAGDTGQMKDDITRIVGAAERMRLLLDDLLELSRIGRLMNPPEDVPLTELAREAASMIAGRITGRGVTVDIAPDLPLVHGDRPRLLEVLENLIDNAVKFMGDQPQPRVQIGMRRDGEGVVLYVRDNGIGIDPRYHDKVFGLFERLDQNVDGTGVGLAIVKRIVEAHGGLIWVESEGTGQGSAFCFTLPGN